MNATEQLAPEVGTAAACRAMGVSRATLYRRRNPSPETSCVRPTRRQPRALDEAERRRVLDLLHSPQFVDQSPAAVHAAILDEGKYLCSVRTMYRILHDAHEVRERRNQLRHPNYKKPELLATGPNQVWSWDITKLLGPAKWTYYHLYGPFGKNCPIHQLNSSATQHLKKIPRMSSGGRAIDCNFRGARRFSSSLFFA